MTFDGEGAAPPPEELATASYSYDLPAELIAQQPIEPRDAARLMVVDRTSGCIDHRTFRDLPEILGAGDLLVANRSRVIPARLRGHKLETGGQVEVLLLRALGEARWEALVRPARRLSPGVRIGFGDREIFAEVVDRTEAAGRVVRFVDAEGHAVAGPEFDRWLDRVGEMPLPPYIEERLETPERYQTVYAREPGSAAAPTAGLHFTPELLARLRERGVGFAHVTLHVGLDTFRPVQTADLREHRIHAEWCELSEAAAANVNRARRVVAVGTTSVRVLESAAAPDARVRHFQGDTRLFIYPGHRFAAVDAMITNFHLPRSSLLMLVSAFAGRDLIASAYRIAVEERYRFFSFGDAMLIV